MRLVPRHRKGPRAELASRIEISQADITADLAYRGEERRAAPAPASRIARGQR